MQLDQQTTYKKQSQNSLIEQNEQENDRINIKLQQFLEQSSLDTALNASNSQQSSFQEQGFQVIGKQSDNQALIVKLQPENVLWHKGVPLFSSKKIKIKLQIDDLVKRIMQFFGSYSSNPRLLSNTGSQMAYYILSKEYPLNGKILILSHSIYKQNFYINFDHLLTINYDSTQYIKKSHPDIKYLKLLQPTSVNLPLFITLQSTKNTAIVEKYLGADQNLFLPNANILAMSQNIKCKWQRRYRQWKFSGEGYIFFQPKSSLNSVDRTLGVRNRQLILINLLIIIIIALLYIVQHLYLK